MEDHRLPKSIAFAILLTIVLFAHASIARSDDTKTGRDFALFVNGGGSFQTNSSAYDARLGQLYQTLKGKGVPKDQMTVLSGNGKKDGVRQEKWTEKEPDSSVSFDYDGDGKDDVKSDATRGSLESAFSDLSKKMKAGDHLTLVITGPSKKEMLSGQVKLKLWGKDVDAKDLGALLKRLPAGATTTIVTDVPFGGDLTDLTSPAVCVLSEHGGKEVGNKPSKYLTEFSKVLSREGATLLAAHRRSTELGSHSLAKFVEQQLAEQERKPASGGAPCLACEVAKMKDSPVGKALRKENRELSKESPVEELAEVVRKDRATYYDGDLKERIAYFDQQSFESRMKAIQQKKKKISEEREAAFRSYLNGEMGKNRPQMEAAQRRADDLKKEIAATSTEEKNLKARYEQLKDELRLILSATPEQTEAYVNLKRCEAHAY